jgi:hypothetical protein
MGVQYQENIGDILHGPPDSAKALWYHPSTNRFEDERGCILHDLQPYFDTWQLDKWKKTKDYVLAKDKNGDLWEIFYNHYDPYCDHFCETCVSKCEIYDLVRNYDKEIY